MLAVLHPSFFDRTKAEARVRQERYVRIRIPLCRQLLSGTFERAIHGSENGSIASARWNCPHLLVVSPTLPCSKVLLTNNLPEPRLGLFGLESLAYLRMECRVRDAWQK
jgi:hypothetical protein